MKMSAGEASILGKIEEIDHNQKKIMDGILILANCKSCPDTYMNVGKSWEKLDKELAEKKRLKAQAKRNGYTLAQWKKKMEEDK